MITVDINKKWDGEKVARIFSRRVTDMVKIAAIEFYRQVQISTPVDTGRARSNWFITINAPSDAVNPEGHYGMGNIAVNMPQGLNITITDTIFITNNTPYIKALNNGHSRQAPRRFVQLAAARVQRAIDKISAQID
jgi:hypothetical protein